MPGLVLTWRVPCPPWQLLRLQFSYQNTVTVKKTAAKWLLTDILSWNSAVGTTGIVPPCFPNFLSKLSWTDTRKGKKKKNGRGKVSDKGRSWPQESQRAVAWNEDYRDGGQRESSGFLVFWEKGRMFSTDCCLKRSNVLPFFSTKLPLSMKVYSGPEAEKHRTTLSESVDHKQVFTAIPLLLFT